MGLSRKTKPFWGDAVDEKSKTNSNGVVRRWENQDGSKLDKEKKSVSMYKSLKEKKINDQLKERKKCRQKNAERKKDTERKK